MSAIASPGTLAPWLAQQSAQLLRQPGHAWLLHGPSGLGQYPLALALACAWLCEAPTESGACGTCSSCHGVAVRTHADLLVLMPETQALERGWPLPEKAQSEIDEKKRKPSREIRVDALRDALEFAQRTSARGRGKVVLVYPADAMNAIAANTLLKTLEEPPGAVRFILATDSAHLLLPTIRSRCLGHALHWPSGEQAQRWLQEQGMDAEQARYALLASGGRPADAWERYGGGRDASEWAGFPRAMVTGDLGAVRTWSLPELLDALHKLCHDALALHVGAAPRFFEVQQLGGLKATLSALSDWSVSLRDARRSMEHPFNAGLAQEMLVDSAQTVLNSALA